MAAHHVAFFPTSSCENAVRELVGGNYESTRLPASNRIEGGDQDYKREWDWGSGGESSLAPMQHLRAGGVLVLQSGASLQD